MAPRPTWKGYLKLSLVSCAVALYTATSTSERVRFNIINRKTGHRVHNQVVDAETGEPVEPEDRVKGYAVDKNRYLLMEEEELDEVALESTHTIDIDGFIPRADVDEIFLDESYYIVPNDKVAQEAFAVIREAMRKKDVVGLARVVLHRRERLLMLSPRDKGMLATVLRYHNEVRPQEEYFDDIPSVKVPGEMLDLATHIIASKMTHFDPSHFKDRYEDALKAVIRAKQAGKPLPKVPEPAESNVIDLMEALRRSVASEDKGKPAAARRTKSRAGPARRRASSRSARARRAG